MEATTSATQKTEAARSAKLLESQQAARQASGGPDWRPAGSPQPGTRGALGSRQLPDSIPSGVKPAGVALPAVIPPPESEEEPTGFNDEGGYDEEGEDFADEEAGYFDEAAAAAALAESQASAATQQAVNQAAEQAKAAAQKAAKQAMTKGKDVFIRWGSAAADTFGVGSDVSTVGVSFLWDCLMYLATLSWYNLEMIYGYYLSGYFRTGEKSLLVSPLSWESLAFDQKPPLPLPDIILHGALVAVDLVFVLALVACVTIGGLLVMLIVDFVNDPTGTVYSYVTDPSLQSFFGGFFSYF